MGHGYRMQAVRNSKYHMEVFHSGYYLLLAHLYPYLTLPVLTLGAMAVTAAVVADMYLATLGAHLDMTAESPCAADCHRSKRLPYLRSHSMPGIQRMTPVTDYLSDLKLGTGHLSAFRLCDIR